MEMRNGSTPAACGSQRSLFHWPAPSVSCIWALLYPATLCRCSAGRCPVLAWCVMYSRRLVFLLLDRAPAARCNAAPSLALLPCTLFPSTDQPADTNCHSWCALDIPKCKHDSAGSREMAACGQGCIHSVQVTMRVQAGVIGPGHGMHSSRGRSSGEARATCLEDHATACTVEGKAGRRSRAHSR